MPNRLKQTTSTPPQISIAEADRLLTGEGAAFEIQEQVVRGVKTRVWVGIPDTLVTLLNHTRFHGDNTFVVLGEERVSYDAFRRAVGNLAKHLGEIGIGIGDRVALAMRNTPEWPVAFFATISVGAIVVPLNAWWTGAELQFGLDDCGARVLICDSERHNRLAEDATWPSAIEHVLITRLDVAKPHITLLNDILGSPNEWSMLPYVDLPGLDLSADDDAVLLYTSGTSGKPKGAIATHRNILSCIASMAFLAARAALRSGQEPTPAMPKVLLLVIPMFHVTGCAANLLPHMWLGSKVVLMTRWDTSAALRLIETEKVTVTGGVPTIAAQLLSDPHRSDHDISSLEVLT